MKPEIKSKLEEYVLDQIENLNNLNKSEDGFLGKEKEAVTNMNIIIDLLQKEDVNISNRENNEEKIKSENNKVLSQHDSELDKIDLEKEKLQSNVELEKEKIKSAKDKQDEDIRIKEKELINDAKNAKKEVVISVIKIVVEVAAITLPIIHNNKWMDRGFEFEKTGTYTVNTFKNLFSKFKPTR